jgi:hypothetical protein
VEFFPALDLLFPVFLAVPLAKVSLSLVVFHG